MLVVGVTAAASARKSSTLPLPVISNRTGAAPGVGTSEIQIGSRGNQWLKDGGNADWVYAYDAWTVPTPSAA